MTRVPPHDETAEQSLLGAMLLSKPEIERIIESDLEDEDFYRGGHRLIFNTIRALYSEGTPVDVVTVVDRLRRDDFLNRVGGPLYVQHLCETVPSPGSALHYGKIVRDTSRLRKLIHNAGETLQAAYEVPSNVDQLIALAESKLHEALNPQQTDIVSMSTIVQQSLDDLEKTQEFRGLTGLPTGLPDLDHLLNGLQPGNLVMVAARPGVGKSTLAGNIARHVSVEAKQAVAFFSLEMSRIELGTRLLCTEAWVPTNRFRGRLLAQNEWSKIMKAAETLDSAKLWIIDSGYLSVVQLRSQARLLKSRNDLRLMIVDYLQLMASHRKVDNRQQEVAEISRSLKLLAKELEIPILAVSQLNRESERRTDKRPQLSDLRESGALEADSDVVILIHREDPLSLDPALRNRAELVLAKNRNGPIGKVETAFFPEYTSFKPLANSNLTTVG